MGFIEILLIAISLSMDAFAVSLCKGMLLKKPSMKVSVIIGLYFGIFQGLMPFIGFFLGTYFSKLLDKIDHLIVFLILTYIGISMINDSLKKEKNSMNNSINIKEMLVLSVATSIDALAVGVTFAFLKVNIFFSSFFIFFICFIISLLGVKLGNKIGYHYEKKAILIGGSILILIGLKILLEHLGFF